MTAHSAMSCPICAGHGLGDCPICLVPADWPCGESVAVMDADGDRSRYEWRSRPPCDIRHACTCCRGKGHVTPAAYAEWILTDDRARKTP